MWVDLWYKWLPAAYNVLWGYRYAPNYVWLLFAIVLLWSGFQQLSRQTWWRLVTAQMLLFIMGGRLPSGESQRYVVEGSALPAETGSIQDHMRIADTSRDRPGHISYGPYMPLRRGKYKITVYVRTPAATSADHVAMADIYDVTQNKVLLQSPITHTAGELRAFTQEIELTNSIPHLMEFRHYWYGKEPMELHRLEVESI